MTSPPRPQTNHSIRLPAEAGWLLLIGIDEYPPDASGTNILHGCVNDVVAWRTLLTSRFGFTEHQTRTLLNANATRDKICEGLAWLLESVRPHERVVLVYAGHGSHQRAAPGRKLSGWHETIVPIDSGRGSKPCRDITDDEIRSWLFQLCQKTPYVTLLFDCCHSATVHRGARGRAMAVEPRIAQEVPTSALFNDVEGNRPLPIAWLPSPDSYVLLAACQDDERAQEVRLSLPEGKVMRGAFSYTMQQALSDSSPAELTYQEWFQRASFALRRLSQGRQRPVIEGALTRQLFGQANLGNPSGWFATVDDRREVSLDAGHLHGLSEGSSITLFDLSQRSARSNDPTARIDQVAPATARGILSSLGTLRPGTYWARLASQPEATKTTVALASDAPANSRQEIQSSPILRVVPNAGLASIRLRQAAPSEHAQSESIPSATLSAATIAVLNGEEEFLLLPPLSQGAVIRDALERLARFGTLQQLQGIRPPNDVRLRFSYRSTGSEWVECELDSTRLSEGLALADGSEIGLHVENKTGLPLYVSVLYLAADRSITQLYPPRGGLALVAPMQASPWLFRQEGLPVHVQSTPARSLVFGQTATSARGERDWLKIVLATERIDLSSWEQPGLYDCGTACEEPGEHPAPARLRGVYRPTQSQLIWWAVNLPIDIGKTRSSETSGIQRASPPPARDSLVGAT